MNRPMMPKATAVWLIDNTSLTFDQIAEFCGLHPLEVKGIADGDVAAGIKGLDPVATGQLTRTEIERAQEDASTPLKMARTKVEVPEAPKRKGPRYTPVSRRQDRPNAVAWLLRHHPELADSQVCKLVGTTKPTINAIRDRTHWNIQNLAPADPVTLGLCKQIELDEAVAKAQARKAKDQPEETEEEGGLMPADQSLMESATDVEEEPLLSSVFGDSLDGAEGGRS